MVYSTEARGSTFSEKIPLSFLELLGLMIGIEAREKLCRIEFAR
jgi:hypothetical protein